MKAAQATEFDAIIVGGGMVGASLACLLENTPLRLALVDQTAFDVDAIPYFQQRSMADGASANQPGFDPRVSAITAEAKWSGKFLSAFPIGALILINLGDPNYYDEVMTHRLFVPGCIAVGLFLGANLLVMRKLTDIKV